MKADTVSNPMWDNFRKLLQIFQEQNIKFNKYQLTYYEGRMEVLILSIIPKCFIIDNNGIYSDHRNISQKI
jgi:hypothetical protein